MPPAAPGYAALPINVAKKIKRRAKKIRKINDGGKNQRQRIVLTRDAYTRLPDCPKRDSIGGEEEQRRLFVSCMKRRNGGTCRDVPAAAINDLTSRRGHGVGISINIINVAASVKKAKNDSIMPA